MDLFVSETFSMNLDKEDAVVVENLLIRSYSPGDEVKMAALINECHSHILDAERRRVRRRREGAEEDKRECGRGREGSARGREAEESAEEGEREIENVTVEVIGGEPVNGRKCLP